MLISNKFCLQNLSSTDVQGSTSVEEYTDVHFSSGTVHTVCVNSQYRHGRRWFHAIATFWQAEPTKTRVQELTRTSILGHSHTKAKTAAAEVREVVVPIGTSGEILNIPPAATALDAAITGTSTLRILPACRRTVAIPVPALFPYVPAHVV